MSEDPLRAGLRDLRAAVFPERARLNDEAEAGAFDEAVSIVFDHAKVIDLDDPFDDAPPAEIERDQYQRPLIEPPPGGWLDAGNPQWAKEEKRYGGRRPYMRMSTAAGLADVGVGLAIWKGRHIATQVARHADLAAVLAGLRYRPDNFTQIDKLIEEALIRGAGEEESLAAANWGTAVHRFTEPYSPPDHPTRLKRDIEAYFVAYEEHGFTVLDTEIFVVCDPLGIAGTFDELLQAPPRTAGCTSQPTHQVRWDRTCEEYVCTDCGAYAAGVGSLRVLLGDKKTGKLHHHGQAMQLAGYAHGWRYDVETGERSPIHPDLSRTEAVLTHIPLGRATCTPYEVDIAKGWENLRRAYAVNEDRRSEKTLFRRWS